MQNIQIVEKITPGDGLMLPAEATLDGLTIPAEASQGFYSLKNVILSSNGTLQVKATPATEWERVGKQIEGMYYWLFSMLGLLKSRYPYVFADRGNE